MKAAFTICANNYLAAAKVLADTFKDHHPVIDFFIVIVDKPSAQINYSDYERSGKILFVNDIIDLDIDDLSLKYNIAELCTTVKPFLFKYFFERYTEVVYLDPDIKIYAPLTECWDVLQQNTFALTPHLMSPVDDGKSPSDLDTLRTGIFNLGFIGISLTGETQAFLNWWGARLLVYGHSDWNTGMFYDQIWANYIPVMSNKYHIIKHPGYNVANWNWHERLITKKGDTFYVNGDWPLVFHHFSNYKHNYPDVLCQYNTRFSRQNRPDLAVVFDEYQQDLNTAGFKQVNVIPAFYQERFFSNVLYVDAQRPIGQKIKRKLINWIKKI
jgi:hypothetical protein